MLVVGQDVVELHPEGAPGALHRLGEEAEDRVHAAMVTREGTPARCMPDGVLIKHLPESLNVALGERVEASADKLLVRVGHDSSLPWTAGGAYDFLIPPTRIERHMAGAAHGLAPPSARLPRRPK